MIIYINNQANERCSKQCYEKKPQKPTNYICEGIKVK